MVRSTWVILSLFATLPLLAADWQEIKREKLAERPVLRAAATGDKALVVDCTKGESVQAAVDKNASPVVIEIHGICAEAVVIQDKVVTLRGTSPATDGLQSPSTAAAVQFVDSRGSVLENLTLSNNARRAVGMVRSTVVMTNCAVNGNHANAAGTVGNGAVAVSSDSMLDATAVTATGNARGVFLVVTNSQLFCHGCEFSNNTGFAASSQRGSLVSLLNSSVSQRDGIQSALDSYVDIDCISEVSAHPCSMQATRRAAYVESGGIASMYTAGDFTGRVEAHDRGSAQVFGARQLAGAQPGQGPSQNIVSTFGTLHVFEGIFSDPPNQSRILSTNVSGFGRLLIQNQTEVSGTIACSSAGDAFLEGTVVQAPGTTITGCEHAP